MADYPAAAWNAWHHHMALVMMAMLFHAYRKVWDERTNALAKLRDIERLLAGFLPRRDASPEQSP